MEALIDIRLRSMIPADRLIAQAGHYAIIVQKHHEIGGESGDIFLLKLAELDGDLWFDAG